MREVTRRYEDPLDRVWIECAARVGLRVVRSDDAYASSDGKGTLSLAHDASLDADDSLAQMIFHELCHSLVQGHASLRLPDWGLDNQSDSDFVNEHGCLRLQALLARPHGLRAVLAPTTDFRAFYDALADDPLDDGASSQLARLGAARSTTSPWGPHLQLALSATAQIVTAVSSFTGASRSIFECLAPSQATHASGFPLGGAESCGSCAWRTERGLCLQARVRVAGELNSCERWEKALNCQACGACCRAGFDTVEIGVRDPVRKLHPELVESRNGRLGIAREGVRCAALSGGSETEPYLCRIYEVRPKPCRELAPGSAGCLIARRRVGLSR